MADNYLEKRMEDMRNGKLKTSVGSAKRTNREFANLRVFVTGGAGGIGRGIVEELRRLGCRVAFCDINKEAGEGLEAIYGAEFYHLDVKEADKLQTALEQILEKWRDLDVIVNNIGIGDFKPFTSCSLEDFEKVLKTNLYPVFITGNVLARHREKMLSEGKSANPYGGRIINISSTRHIQSEEGTEAYAATKGAVFSLTHALMMSMRRFGVTVNCISPGWINTENGVQFSEADKKQHPSGRVGTPGDIARMVAFLINPANNFINGQDIVIDGGMTKQMIYSGDHLWLYNIQT